MENLKELLPTIPQGLGEQSEISDVLTELEKQQALNFAISVEKDRYRHSMKEKGMNFSQIESKMLECTIRIGYILQTI